MGKHLPVKILFLITNKKKIKKLSKHSVLKSTSIFCSTLKTHSSFGHKTRFKVKYLQNRHLYCKKVINQDDSEQQHTLVNLKDLEITDDNSILEEQKTKLTESLDWKNKSLKILEGVAFYLKDQIFSKCNIMDQIIEELTNLLGKFNKKWISQELEQKNVVSSLIKMWKEVEPIKTKIYLLKFIQCFIASQEEYFREFIEKAEGIQFLVQIVETSEGDQADYLVLLAVKMLETIAQDHSLPYLEIIIEAEGVLAIIRYLSKVTNHEIINEMLLSLCKIQAGTDGPDQNQRHYLIGCFGNHIDKDYLKRSTLKLILLTINHFLEFSFHTEDIIEKFVTVIQMQIGQNKLGFGQNSLGFSNQGSQVEIGMRNLRLNENQHSQSGDCLIQQEGEQNQCNQKETHSDSEQTIQIVVNCLEIIKNTSKDIGESETIYFKLSEANISQIISKLLHHPSIRIIDKTLELLAELLEAENINIDSVTENHFITAKLSLLLKYGDSYLIQNVITILQLLADYRGQFSVLACVFREQFIPTLIEMLSSTNSFTFYETILQALKQLVSYGYSVAKEVQCQKYRKIVYNHCNPILYAIFALCNGENTLIPLTKPPKDPQVRKWAQEMIQKWAQEPKIGLQVFQVTFQLV